MKAFLEEFRKFISRGNVMDMAVGIIIGGAFTTIVTSLCDDIISPILGIFGGMDFSNLSVTLGGEATLRYGNFITAVINFIIMAFVIFCMVKAMNTVRDHIPHQEEEEAPATKICPYCRSEIDIEATRCPHCTSIIEEAAEMPALETAGEDAVQKA